MAKANYWDWSGSNDSPSDNVGNPIGQSADAVCWFTGDCRIFWVDGASTHTNYYGDLLQLF
jgi:hypothetical protein